MVWGLLAFRIIKLLIEVQVNQLPEVRDRGLQLQSLLFFEGSFADGLGELDVLSINPALEEELLVPTQHRIIEGSSSYQAYYRLTAATPLPIYWEYLPLNLTVASPPLSLIIMDSPAEEIADSRASLSHVLRNYTLKKTLGKGTFGKVKAAIHIPTSEMVAIKIIDKSTIRD